MKIVYFSIFWIGFGLLNYWIKYSNYKKDWEKPENKIFFVAVLIGSLIFGPIGLILTVYNSMGKPFIKK